MSIWKFLITRTWIKKKRSGRRTSLRSLPLCHPSITLIDPQHMLCSTCFASLGDRMPQELLFWFFGFWFGFVWAEAGREPPGEGPFVSLFLAVEWDRGDPVYIFSACVRVCVCACVCVCVGEGGGVASCRIWPPCYLKKAVELNTARASTVGVEPGRWLFRPGLRPEPAGTSAS